ncbi:MAG: cell division protein FtsL [Alphaproteobacteria bacterium]
MVRITVFWLGLLAVSAGLAVTISNKVHHLEKQKRMILADVQHHEENRRVLQAEWSYLNEPARLESLAKRYLGMQAVNQQKLVFVGSLPARSTNNDVNVRAVSNIVAASNQQLRHAAALRVSE